MEGGGYLFVNSNIIKQYRGKILQISDNRCGYIINKIVILKGHIVFKNCQRVRKVCNIHILSDIKLVEELLNILVN